MCKIELVAINAKGGDCWQETLLRMIGVVIDGN